MHHRPFGTPRPAAARRLLLGIVLALPAHPALAITVSQSEVDDPIAAGQTCNVRKPSSYGSYIYYAPSRFDFVFWPLSDWIGVWHCERSGFTALIGDFDGLSGAEAAAIRDYLAANYDGAADPVARLELLEGIYRLRNKEPAFDNRLLRVLARHYQDIGLLERANERRLQAFEQLKALLETDLPVLPRLEYLYLAANYARQFGDVPASERYLSQLSDAMEGIADAELAGHLSYLSELAKQTRLIQPGGRLDPPWPR